MDTKILHSVNVIIIRRTIFPSYFENFLTRAFIQIYFLLTRWTQKSSILCKISVNVIIIRRTIFPSTPIIMCESVSVFLSCKSKYGHLLHKLALFRGSFNNYVDKKSTLVHLFQNVFHTIVHWICTYITLH